MKIPELCLEEHNVICQGLRLKRESLLRSRNKVISGSKLFNFYNDELAFVSSAEQKMFTLVDGVSTK